MATTTNEVVTLESGDLLTRAEFHRRYRLRPDIKKAELVNGVVYVASPLRFEQRAEPTMTVGAWLGLYISLTPGVRGGHDATVLLTDDGEVQPDALLFWGSPRGANVRINDSSYLVGAPELVVEIAASSASYDLHDKLMLYERAGVLEYLVWRTEERAFDWFRLLDGAYVRIAPDAAGLIESSSFPGLRLNVAKLIAGDLAGVLAALGPAA